MGDGAALDVRLHVGVTVLDLLVTHIGAFLVLGRLRRAWTDVLYGLLAAALSALVLWPYLVAPYVLRVKDKLVYALSVVLQHALLCLLAPLRLNALGALLVGGVVAVGSGHVWTCLAELYTCVTYSTVRERTHHVGFQEIVGAVVLGYALLWLIGVLGSSDGRNAALEVWHRFSSPAEFHTGSVFSRELLFFAHVAMAYISLPRVARHGLCEWPGRFKGGDAKKQGTYKRLAILPKDAISAELDGTHVVPNVRTWNAKFDAVLARKLVVDKISNDSRYRTPLRQQEVPVAAERRLGGEDIYLYEEDQRAMDSLMARRAHYVNERLNEAQPDDLETEKTEIRRHLNKREEALLDAFCSIHEYLRPELVEHGTQYVNAVAYNMLSIEQNTLAGFIDANFTNYMMWNKRKTKAEMAAEVYKIFYSLTLDIITTCLYYISFIDKDTPEYVSFVSALGTVINGVNIFTQGDGDYNAALLKGRDMGITKAAKPPGYGQIAPAYNAPSGMRASAYGGRQRPFASGGAYRHYQGGGAVASNGANSTLADTVRDFSKVDTMATINHHYNIRIEYGDIAIPYYRPPPQTHLEKTSRLGELVDNIVTTVKLTVFKGRLFTQGFLRRSFADCPVIPTLLIDMECSEVLIQNLSKFVEKNNLQPHGVPQFNAPLNALVGVFLHSVNILSGVVAYILSNSLVAGPLFKHALLVDLRARRILALL